MLKFIVILLFLFSCNNEKIVNDISGTYVNNEFIIGFNQYEITGKTKCNDFHGHYNILYDNIYISISGTKIGCENDFNYRKLNTIKKITLEGNVLKLYNSQFTIILHKL